MNARIQNKIGTPREAHLVSSPEQYEEWARAVMVTRRQIPEIVPGLGLHAYVSGGWWLVRCPCGNCPHADPDWRIAICPECGSKHEAVFPRNRDAVEAALLERPHHRTRSYFWHKSHPLHLVGHKPETVARLQRENRDHGIGKER